MIRPICCLATFRDEPTLLLKSSIFFPVILLKFTYYSQDFAHENEFLARNSLKSNRSYQYANAN